MTRWLSFRRRHAERSAVLLGGVMMTVLCARGDAQVPEWIWRENKPAQANEVCFFQKQFSVGFQAQRAELTAAGDDEITVYLNGREVARRADWKKPVTVEVTSAMREGANILAVRGRNGSAGAAAVFAKLEVRSPNNFGLFVVTDKSWQCSSIETSGWETSDFSQRDWKPAVSLGSVGVAP